MYCPKSKFEQTVHVFVCGYVLYLLRLSVCKSIVKSETQTVTVFRTRYILNGNSNVNSSPSLSINWMPRQFAHRTVFKMGILLFSLLFKLKLLLIH